MTAVSVMLFSAGAVFVLGLLVTFSPFGRWMTSPAGTRFYNSERRVAGGLVFGAAFWAGLLSAGWGNLGEGDLFYAADEAVSILRDLAVGTFCIGAASIWLDRQAAPSYRGWAAVAIAAALMAFGPLSIDRLSLPLKGTVFLSPAAGSLLAFAWVLVLVGVVEVLEGLAWWCVTLPLSVVAGWYYLSAPAGELLQQAIAMAMIGALVGSVPLRFFSGGLYLGHTGCKLAAFLFAALTLLGRQKAHAAQFLVLPILACVVYVIVETTGRMYRQFQRR